LFTFFGGFFCGFVSTQLLNFAILCCQLNSLRDSLVLVFLQFLLVGRNLIFFDKTFLNLQFGFERRRLLFTWRALSEREAIAVLLSCKKRCLKSSIML
jgi:hypothetical protein